MTAIIYGLKVTARENYDSLTVDEEDKRENRNRLDKYTKPVTTGSLTINNRLVKCVFCKGDHYSDKCNVVADMKARAVVIKKNRLCYRCLQPYHGIKNCRSRMKCFKCQSVRHHTAICEGEHGEHYEDKAKGEGKFDNPPIQTVAHKVVHRY